MDRDREYRPAPMSLAQRAALRSQQPGVPYRRPARRGVTALTVVLVLLVLLVVAVGGFEFYYRDRVLPRVQVRTANVDVSGLSRAAAADRLAPFSLSQRFRGIALFGPEHTKFIVAAYTLGYDLDRGLTAWRAYNVGHGGSLLRRAKDQVNTLLKGSSVPLAQGVNQRVLSAYLMKLAVKINRRPHPGKPGYRLDGARAQGQITRMLLGTVGGFKLFLPVTTLPALPAKHPAVKHSAVVHHIAAKPKHKKKKL